MEPKYDLRFGDDWTSLAHHLRTWRLMPRGWGKFHRFGFVLLTGIDFLEGRNCGMRWHHGVCDKFPAKLSWFPANMCIHLGVSKYRGTPKSSILIGFSIINHPFWWFSFYFWKHPFCFILQTQQVFVVNVIFLPTPCQQHVVNVTLLQTNVVEMGFQILGKQKDLESMKILHCFRKRVFQGLFFLEEQVTLWLLLFFSLEERHFGVS